MSLLRACGGLPHTRPSHGADKPPTPRMRRSTLGQVSNRCSIRAYSAHAEVYPVPPFLTVNSLGLLRACGGLPRSICPPSQMSLPTPRMRRSTLALRRLAHPLQAYSAHAEVYPEAAWVWWRHE